jgi:hypothetical protein
MKTSKPAIIALLLWLLFVASNAFAVFKPPYPLRVYPPDQTTVNASGLGGLLMAMENKAAALRARNNNDRS